MSIEQRLRDELCLDLDVLVAPPSDLIAVVDRGRRIRTRRRAVAGAVLLTLASVVAVAATVVPLSGPDTGTAPATTPSAVRLSPGWHALPAPPDLPNAKSMRGWTGTELLFVGGQDVRDRAVADGYAYDPAAGTWRTIAPAPRPFYGTEGETSTVVGDQLVVATFDGLLAYDASDDAWRELPDPPEPLPEYFPDLVGDGETVYVPAESGRILALDLATGTWSSLPIDDQAPRVDYVDSLVAVPGGLAASVVLRGTRSDAYPIYVDVWDGRGWRRMPSGQAQGFYQWTGERLLGIGIDPTSVDGVRQVTAGAITLDGAWSQIDLPRPPTLQSPRAITNVGAGEGPVLFTGGRLYDDTTGSWTDVPAPPGVSTSPFEAVVADGLLYLYGGLDGDGDRLDQAWVYVP